MLGSHKKQIDIFLVSTKSSCGEIAYFFSTNLAANGMCIFACHLQARSRLAFALKISLPGGNNSIIFTPNADAVSCGFVQETVTIDWDRQQFVKQRYLAWCWNRAKKNCL